jgi:glutamate carboxypeptidase
MNRLLGVLVLSACAAPLAAQTTLTRQEQRLRDAVRASAEERLAYLQRTIDIPSSTFNVEGVRRVGDVMRASFDSLGFTTTWVAMPPEMRRAGHLVAVHRGRPGATRILLIGHFDTVVEPAGPTYAREDSIVRGIGASDMKGGNVIILYALKALQSIGALRDLNVTVVFTGDEEEPGEPRSVARAPLLDVARENDVALAFEGGMRSQATVARRGTAGWRVTATGRQAHSAGIFGPGTGYGAIYELARILDGFRTQVVGERHLTLNIATVLGGTDVVYDSAETRGSTASKDNIVPRLAIAEGDLRFLTLEQRDSAWARMRRIVAQHLPGTGAEISVTEGYPPMPPTPGNERLLAVLDTASRALGYGPVTALDPAARGAGDLSFVAPLLDGLEGFGALGSGSHTPNDRASIPGLDMQTERAGLVILRLGVQRGEAWRRPASR